jgi:ribonuclease P protein component
VQRLKTRAQFQAVMAGTTVSRTAHFALHRLGLDVPQASIAPESGSERPASSESLPTAAASGQGFARPKPLFAVREPWMGALIPKRWAKRAVTRNAIKRQIYSVSLEFEPQLPVAAHVVRLRAGFDRKQYISATSEVLKRAVRGELQQLFARAAP